MKTQRGSQEATKLFKNLLNIIPVFRDSSVVERLTVNQDVAGSNPAPGAKKHLRFEGVFLILVV